MGIGVSERQDPLHPELSPGCGKSSTCQNSQNFSLKFTLYLMGSALQRGKIHYVQHGYGKSSPCYDSQNFPLHALSYRNQGCRKAISIASQVITWLWGFFIATAGWWWAGMAGRPAYPAPHQQSLNSCSLASLTYWWLATAGGWPASGEQEWLVGQRIQLHIRRE